jgi:hypothetical protein
MLKELPIAQIKVGSRHRKDMGDLTSLAESIRQEGLLQPIGVTEDLRLVFGERRVRATRDILKTKTILARIVDVNSIINGEYAENEIRKDFTASKRVDIATAIERKVGNRQGQRTDKQRVREWYVSLFKKFEAKYGSTKEIRITSKTQNVRDDLGDGGRLPWSGRYDWRKTESSERRLYCLEHGLCFAGSSTAAT